MKIEIELSEDEIKEAFNTYGIHVVAGAAQGIGGPCVCLICRVAKTASDQQVKAAADAARCPRTDYPYGQPPIQRCVLECGHTGDHRYDAADDGAPITREQGLRSARRLLG